MQFQRFDGRVQLRFESGEHVAPTLIDWLTSEGIGYATMTGLGAVKSATVSYWKDGKPFTHIHVTLGRRDLFVVGGHFNDAVVHPNLEIWLQREDEPVHRALDEACGLFVMQLPERP